MSRKHILLFVLFDLFILIPGVLLLFVPQFRYVSWTLIGRGQGCTLERSFNADAHIAELTKTKDRILAGQKFLGTEGPLEHYSTPYGEFWAPNGSKWTLPFNLAEQEVAIYGRPPLGVRRGDTVIDCGANVGTYARFALNAGAAKVIAVEPAPDNIECLRRNFSREIAEGRLVVYPKGVWDKDDVLDFRVDAGNQAADSFVIERKGDIRTIKLPLTTIDKLVDELELARVDLIKMDIEGAEVPALKGGRETIAKHHPRLAISAYHRPSDPVEIPATIRAIWTGYRTHCGPCVALSDRWMMRPDVLIFY